MRKKVFMVLNPRYQCLIEEQLKLFHQDMPAGYSPFLVHPEVLTANYVETPLWAVMIAQKPDKGFMQENMSAYYHRDKLMLKRWAVPPQFAGLFVERELNHDRAGIQVLTERQYGVVNDDDMKLDRLLAMGNISFDSQRQMFVLKYFQPGIKEAVFAKPWGAFPVSEPHTMDLYDCLETFKQPAWFNPFANSVT